MKRTSLACVALSLLLAGCGDKSSPAGNSGSGSGSVLTAPADYLKSAADAEHAAVKSIDTSSISDAIQLVYADKGRYPKDLNELVTEKYMAKVPTPPVGTRLDYDPATGAVKVVSQ
jgi:hypothetical protein